MPKGVVVQSRQLVGLRNTFASRNCGRLSRTTHVEQRRGKNRRKKKRRRACGTVWTLLFSPVYFKTTTITRSSTLCLARSRNVLFRSRCGRVYDSLGLYDHVDVDHKLSTLLMHSWWLFLRCRLLFVANFWTLPSRHHQEKRARVRIVHLFL